MSYQFIGLSAEKFQPYFKMSNAELDTHNAKMLIADDDEYPCRVSLNDATKGDRLILVNYEHLPVSSPYRSAHAIYVAEGSKETSTLYAKVPKPILRSTVSIRAFDADDMMINADITAGKEAEKLILRFFENPDTAYLHVHYAKRGCFAARVCRAGSSV